MWLHNLVYSNHPIQRVWRHILFWLSFILYRGIEYMPSGNFYSDTRELLNVLRNGFFHIPVMAILVYSGMYFVLPRYLATFRYRAAILGCSGLFLLAFGMNYLIESGLSSYFYPVALPLGEHLRNTETTTITLMIPFFLAAIAFKLTKDHIVRQRENQLLLLDRLQAGFKLTKAKLQPVILVDALREIHGDILGEYRHAPTMILRLSSLLRYILYETDVSQVPARDEIKMMGDYIALKTIRNNKKMTIEFLVTGSPDKRTIPPLLCLPIIDMLFRRNEVKETISHICVVWLFQGEQWSLSLACKQNCDQSSLTGIDSSVLQVTRHNLEINYPGRFVFEVDEGKEHLDIFIEIKTPVIRYA